MYPPLEVHIWPLIRDWIETTFFRRSIIGLFGLGIWRVPLPNWDGMQVGGAYGWTHKVEGLNSMWFPFNLWSSTHLFSMWALGLSLLLNTCHMGHAQSNMPRCNYYLLYYNPLGVVWFDTKYWMVGINMPHVIPTLGKTMFYPNVGINFWHL